MAHPVKQNSLLRSLLSDSAPYNLALSVIILCLSSSVAVALGEDAGGLKALQVQTVAYPQLQPTFFSLLAQAKKTPSPQKPSTSFTNHGQPETRVLVNEVAVSGVKGELEDEVYKTIKTKPGYTTTRSQLQADINAIFATGFFSNVAAVAEDTPLGVRVKFEVKPTILTKVQVQANPGTNVPSALPPSTVHEIFRNQYGRILNLRDLLENIKRLTKRYQDQGYVLANVIGAPQVSENGVVTLKVVEGVIEHIGVRFVNSEKKYTDEQGKPIRGRVPPSAILQQIQLKPGKVFNRTQMQKDIQRVYSLGFFEDVNISSDPGKDPSKVIVLVNVAENQLASHAQEILKYQEQLRIYRAKKDQLKEAEVLEKLARVYKDAEEHQQAIAKYEEALRIYKSKKDQVRVVNLLNKIGIIYYDSKEEEDNKKAIAKYQEALQIYKSQQDPLGEAKILNNLGNTYYKLKQYQQAIDVYTQALPIFKNLNLPFWQALTLSNIGFNYRELEDKDRSLEFYNQALLLWRHLRNNPSHVKLHSEEQKVKVAASSKNDEPTGSFAFGFGASTLKGPWFDAHIQIGKILGKISETPSISDIRICEAGTIFNIASIYQLTGDFQPALYSFNDALLLWQSLSYGQLLSELGAIESDRDKLFFISYFKTLPKFFSVKFYSDLGLNQQAQDDANQLFQQLFTPIFNDLSKDSSDGKRFASIVDNFFTLLAQKETSDEFLAHFFDRILSLLPQQAKNPTLEASIFTSNGDSYAKAGKTLQALDYYNQALKKWKAVEDNGQLNDSISINDKIKTLKSLGKVLVDLGKIQQALSSYNQALNLLQAKDDKSIEAEILYLIGKAYSTDKQYQQALSYYYNRALPLSQQLGDILREADTHLGIAIAERQQGNLAQAKTQIETAIENIESERAQASATEQNKENQKNPSPSKQTDYKSYVELAKYLESKQNYYDFYVDLLMQLHQHHPSEGYNIQALQASERSHARSLLAIINKASRNPQGKAPTANRSNPNYVELAKLPQIKEVQQQVLDDDTLLLEYSLGEEHSYLWAVTKTSITTYELPKRGDIELASRQFYDFLTVPSLRIRTNKAAKAGVNLSQMLLGPISKQLGNKRLLVVADGVLQYIPFSALPVPNSVPLDVGSSSTSAEPLLVKHEIINLPSASTLAFIRRNSQERQSPTKTLAVLADPVFNKEDERLTSKPSETSSQSKQNLSTSVNGRGVQSHTTPVVEQLYPRLPGTRQEANQILSLVSPSEELQKFGFAASRQAVLNSELSQYRLIHFATHGILDTQKPERSGILLSVVNEQGELQRGLLSTPDIFNLKLSADIVALSGCRTGLGKQIKGEGLIGLTGGLMYSGAKRVLVSLWSVDDQATAELMSRFYQGVLKDKLPPAKALRAAQLAMWQEQRWQNPYYWAAFTIQGEWN